MNFVVGCAIIFATCSLTLFIDLSNAMNFLNYHPKTARKPVRKIAFDDSAPVSAGDPLILTPYLEAGKIDEARNLSRVVDLDGYSYPSYSGYFTVAKEFNSSMFFWFFPAQNGDINAPLILWLQGGPGAPSMFGIFEINGPIYVTEKLELKERAVHWNLHYNLIYIDNPVLTGFSFTHYFEGVAKNQGDVAENLYKTLLQFYQLFPEYKSNDFYLTGESYAGKYVPSLGFKIHEANQGADASTRINMVGIALGNPLNDPLNTLDAYHDLFYYIGLISYKESQYVQTQTLKASILMEAEQFSEANIVINNLLSYLSDITQVNLNDFMDTEGILEYYVDYLNQTYVRRKIHVGGVPYEVENIYVLAGLDNDVMDSQAKNFSFLIDEGYKALLYSGIQDLQVGAALTENSIRDLCFEAKNEYLNATKKIWRLETDKSDVAGYVSSAQNFLRVNIRGAGHVVPHDQPERALEMITNFIEDKDFST